MVIQVSNFARLRVRWPEYAEELDVEAADRRTVVGDTPYTVLVHEGLHISSAFDPVREAELQASRVPQESGSVWIYGVGAGYLANMLLARPQIQTLDLVFFNYDLLAESLATYEHEWIDDPRVSLHFAGDLKRIEWPFAAVYTELSLAEIAGMPLRDRVQTELNAEVRRRVLKRRCSDNEQTNLQQNRVFAASDPDVSELFETRSGRCITVVAGGPSVDSFLENPVASDCLIAVSTVLAALLKADMAPDIVVVLDGHNEMIKHFDCSVSYRDQLADTELVYPPTINTSIIESWPGKRMIFYLDRPLFRELECEFPHSALFCSGTVTHSAVDLAVRMGAAEVRLVGTDFGFPGGFSHASNTTQRRQLSGFTQVENGEGGLIDSTPALVGYLRDLEDYIECHPEVDFVSMSDQGAAIAGTRLYERVLK